MKKYLLREALLISTVVLVGFVYTSAQNIESVSSINTPGQAQGMFLHDNLIFIADGDSGISIVDITEPEIPQLVSRYNTLDIAHCVFISGSYAYIGIDHTGIEIANISDIANPAFVSTFDTPCLAMNLTVKDGVAYIADGPNAFAVIDVSNPHEPQLIEAFEGMGVSDVCFRDNYVFTAGWLDGMRIFDISEPYNLQEIGSVYYHESHVERAICLDGDLAYLACGHNGFWIIDISDYSQPELITQQPTQAYAVDIYVRNNFAFIADLDKGVIAFDITDPQNLIPVGYYQTSSEALAITGDEHYIYLATKDDGLLVAEMSDAKSSVTPNYHYAEKSHPPSPVITLNADVTTDVGVTRILSPDVQPGRGNCPIIIEVANFGTEPQIFDIIFNSYDDHPNIPPCSLLYTDTIFNYSLAPASFNIVSFTDSINFTRGGRVHKCHTTLPGDMRSYNDTTTGYSTLSEYCYYLWYGNPDLTPVEAPIGNTFHLDVYYMGNSLDIHMASIACIPAFNDLYIHNINQNYFECHYPLSTWDDKDIYAVEGSPPNPVGWTSITSYAIKEVVAPFDSPVLCSIVPIKILTFELETVLDSALFDSTVNFANIGLSSTFGHTNGGDTACGMLAGPILEYFSPLHFFTEAQAQYVPGDINGDGHVGGLDVTYGVQFFRGCGENPPDSCYDVNLETWVYPAADVNGDCYFVGSDITYLVRFFRGQNDRLKWCPHIVPLE